MRADSVSVGCQVCLMGNSIDLRSPQLELRGEEPTQLELALPVRGIAEKSESVLARQMRTGS
jgi:hypothetical protein